MISFILNGKPVKGNFHSGTTLFDYLRDQGYFGVKFSAEKGETGSDAVLVNGKIMNTSLLLMHTMENCTIETVESFAEGTEVHPLQEHFIEEGAIQCGYCTPGMILAIESLMRDIESPTEEDVRDALAGVYCRCTGFVKPVEAAKHYLAAKNTNEHYEGK